jgi:hypothetical protein
MKKLLAAALLSTSLVGVSLPAHAAPFATYDVSCGASVLIIGTYSPNRDVNVSVVYDHGSWRVVHTLNNGDVYERGVQYDIADTSNASQLMWAGTLRRNGPAEIAGSHLARPALTQGVRRRCLPSDSHDQWRSRSHDSGSLRRQDGRKRR